MLPSGTALLLVDIQQGFDDPAWGTRNNPEAEVQIVRLLGAWRQVGWPVLHVQHLSTEPDSPLRPDQPGSALRPEVAPQPGEPLFQKHVNSAFIGTGLEAYLRERAITTLLVVGLTTNHCISTTVRMAGNLGFETYVAADATATFARTGHDGQAFSADEVHAVALASLHGEFATVVAAEDVLDALPG
ncbi:MAG: cysteine hydrolase family protein [Bacteroidota bacterium]